MDRNLDGIYAKIRRGNMVQAVCLSDMTDKELDEVLKDKCESYLRGAVKHLAKMLKEVGDITDYRKEY